MSAWNMVLGEDKLGKVGTIVSNSEGFHSHIL